jgi:hypothetical protein
MQIAKPLNSDEQSALLGAKTPPQNSSFAMIFALLSIWMVGGLCLDGWAHNHLASSLETFFTPWHGVLYSGFAACALALLAFAAINHRKGYAWRYALPTGYLTSLIGAGIFAAAGTLDMFWHLAFGTEKSIEALISPPHLVIALGGVLIAAGPLRAAWMRARSPEGMREWLPVVISMTTVFTIITFMSQFAHFVRDAPTGAAPADHIVAGIMQCQNVAGYILQSGLLLGTMLLVIRRWGTRLPAGVFTVLLGGNMFGMAFMTDEYRLIWAALVAGFFADVLARYLRPSESVLRLRMFSTLVPASTVLLLFVAWRLSDTIWWSVHMWSGAIVLAGVGGLFLSFLLSPPWPKRFEE